MKWLLITLAQTVASFAMTAVGWLASFLFETLWLGGGKMQALGQGSQDIITAQNPTLDTFFNVFASANYVYPIVKAIAIFMVNIFFLVSLFKAFFGPLTEAENPFKMAGRYFIYVVLIFIIKPLINLTLNIATVPFLAFDNFMEGQYGGAGLLAKDTKDAFPGGFSVDSLISNAANGGAENAAKQIVESALFATFDILLLILVVVMLMIFIEFLKYIIEIVMRYTLLGVLVILAPFALACGPFEKTAQICQGWRRAFTSQLVLIFLSNFFLKVFVNSWNYFAVAKWYNGVSNMVAMMMFYSWLRIAQKADTYMQSMGAGALRQGDELSLAMFAATKIALGPAIGATNALGTFASKGMHNPGFTLDKAKMGKLTPDGTNKFTHPLDFPSRHGIGQNLAKKVMNSPKTGPGSMGGSTPLDKALGTAGNMSPETIKNAVNGMFGQNKSMPSKFLDSSVQSMLNSAVSSDNPLRGAEISKAAIDPEIGAVMGAYEEEKDGNKANGNFMLYKAGNPLSMEALTKANEDKSIGQLEKDGVISSFTDGNGDKWYLQKMPNDALSGSSIVSPRVTSSNQAIGSGTISSNTMSAMGAKSLDIKSPSDTGSVGEGLNNSLDPASIGLVEDGVNGCVVQMPSTGEFVLAEGFDKSDDGSMVMAPLTNSDYAQDITGDGDYFPTGTTYSLAPGINSVITSTSGNAIVRSDGMGDVYSSYTYSSSPQQVYANDVISSGSILNDINTGVFEIDTARTFGEDGAYIEGSHVYDTEGGIHECGNIQVNDRGGWNVYAPSLNSEYFASSDGRVYKSVEMNDNGSIKMFEPNHRGIMQEVSGVPNNYDMVQVKTVDNNGNEMFVSPRKFSDDGYVEGISYTNGGVGSVIKDPEGEFDIRLEDSKINNKGKFR